MTKSAKQPPKVPQPAPSSFRPLHLIVPVVLALVIALLFLALRQDKPKTQSKQAEKSPEQAQEPSWPTVSPPPAVSFAKKVPVTPGVDGKPDEPWVDPTTLSPEERERRWRERMQQVIANFEKYWRYPMASRPMSENSELLLPHHVEPTVRPLSRDAKETSKTFIRTSQDRMFMTAGETAAVMIEAFQDGNHAQASVSRAWLSKMEGEPTTMGPPIAPIHFHDDGVAPDQVANDGIQTALVDPPQSQLATFAGNLAVAAEVTVGSENGNAYFTLTYTGNPPARFTGTMRDVVEDGSLVFYAGVEVYRPGRYNITARVEDAGGKAFALIEFKESLDQSSKEARLLVFGKLIHDEGALAPFSIRDVEGMRFIEDAHPDREMMAMWAGPFQSQRYPMTSFSDKDYDTPEKNRQLGNLKQDLAAGLNGNQSATPQK
jgi:hypothetical protein